jgi:hypothetical protein
MGMPLGKCWNSTVAVVLVLLPLCTWYRRYKRAHPHGWPQYI